MNSPHCESCGAKPDQDIALGTVVVDGIAFRVCARCAEASIVQPQLPFKEGA